MRSARVGAKAREVGDRIIVMDGRLIVEERPPEVLLAGPKADRLGPFLRRYQGDDLAE